MVKINQSNESGRTILEMIIFVSFMGLLSALVLWGYNEATKRKIVANLSDLVTKSAAGVITSGYLDENENYKPVNGNAMQIGEALPVHLYISNVQRVSADSETAQKYGLEAFWGDGGSVISAYALNSGRGVVINLNQFPAEVCQLLLDADLSYQGVVDLNTAVDVGHNNVNYGVYYSVDSLTNPDVKRQICNSKKDTLDFGLVFENEILHDDTKTFCNSICATEVLGECALTYNLPECEGEGCARKFFRMQSCAWVCYDGLGDECKPPEDRPFWDDDTKKYICRNQADCKTNQYCDPDTRSCRNCDDNYVGTDTPNEDETEGKYRYCVCPSGFFVDGDKKCTCIAEGGQWTESQPCCPNLKSLSATTSGDSKRCCPPLTYWKGGLNGIGGECIPVAGVTCDEEGTCYECNEQNATEKCPGRDQYCDLTTGTCQVCSRACGGVASDDKLSCEGGCKAGTVCISKYYDNNCCYQEAPNESTVLDCVPVAMENPDEDWHLLPDCNTAVAAKSVCRAVGAYNGAKFIISAEPMTFPAADTWCRSMGWHLATRTEACMKADAGSADGWNCYNIRGKFGYKTGTGNETVWVASARDAVNGSCCTQLSVTNSCSDNHATDARRFLYALCAPGALATDAPNCAMGEYSDSAGCHACPAGYYCLGDLEKYKCPEGYYCPAGTSGPCTETKNDLGQVTSTCPTNAAVPCQLGEYCPAGTTKKTSCPQGYYCPTPTEKIVCPAGALCPAGSVKPTACPTGTYRSGTGGYTASHCSTCSAGYYCPDEGMTTYANTPCPAGAYCPAGSAELTSCPAGTYRKDPKASALSHCTVCPAGSYCPEEGMAAPVPCEANTYTNQKGQTECQPCDDGTYAAAGSTVCQTCSAGTYVCTAASCQSCDGDECETYTRGECVACNIGYYCPGSGKQVACPENYICPDTWMGKPKPCDAGTYTAKTGQTECLECQVGHYCPYTNDFN